MTPIAATLLLAVALTAAAPLAHSQATSKPAAAANADKSQRNARLVGHWRAQSDFKAGSAGGSIVLGPSGYAAVLPYVSNVVPLVGRWSSTSTTLTLDMGSSGTSSSRYKLTKSDRLSLVYPNGMSQQFVRQKEAP